MDNKYHVQVYIKNLDKWKEYIAELKEEKGDSYITLEEAIDSATEFGVIPFGWRLMNHRDDFEWG